MPEERHVIAERLLKQHLGDQAARAEALNMANGPGIDGVPIYGDIIGSQRPALPRNEAPGGMMPVQQPGAMQIRGYLDENEDMTPMGEEFLALVDAGMFDDRGNLTAEGKAFSMTRQEVLDNEDALESYMIRDKAGLDETPDTTSLADTVWNLGRDFVRGAGILIGRPAQKRHADRFTTFANMDGIVSEEEQKELDAIKQKEAFDTIALQELGKQTLTGNATLGSGGLSVLQQGAAKLEGNEFKFYQAKRESERQIAEFNDASAGELWGGAIGSMEAISNLEKQAADAEALIGPEKAEQARREGGAASILTDPSTILTMGAAGFVSKGGVALSMTAKAEKAAMARLAALEATAARASAETVAKRSAELSRRAASRADNLQALGKDSTMARSFSERMAAKSAESWDDVTKLDAVIAERAGDVAKLTKDARVAEALLGMGERARALRAVPFKAFGELAERMGASIIKLDDGLREAATKYGFESVGKVLSSPLTPVAIGAITAGPVGAVVAGAGRALASGPVLKSIGNFSRVVGAETLQRRGMIPFWQRVANNSTLTPVARATAHLLDTATLGGKAGIPLRMAGQAAKGTAAAAPIDMAFEWVEAGGDLGPAEMKQALAESILFGGGSGVVAGSRAALQQQQLGDEINFRNGLVDREALAFGRMNPGARRVLSSYAAANPALRFNLTTEGNSFMDRTSNTMTLNTRQSDWMAPIIGHEVSHFIQIKGQMEAGITAMLVGDGATGGILRAPDGSLNPDFKRFADAYNGRLVAQGINPLPIGDIAIEYFTESTVDDITTMVESGELARMAGRTNAERMVREMSRNLIGRVPFIRDLAMKFGTGMDRGGRMVMGTGILADGVRTIPGARAMLRGLMREQAGRRGDGVISEESATIPVQIMRDDPAMRSAMFSTLETDAAGNPIVDANGNVSITSRETELRRMAAGLIITELEAERIQNGRQLPEGELAPQTDGSWQGTHLSPEALQRLADSGVFNAKQLAMLGMLNRSAKGLTGETFLMIYQAATIPRKGKRKGYGTLPATFREVVPVGVKITKDGNIIVETMSVTQLVENVRERAASKRGKRLYNGSQVEILRDAQAVLDLHRKGERTDTYFADKYGSINGPEYKNFVNTAFGLMTRSQQDVNPIFAADSIRAGGVFKSRRLDRINQTTRMQGKPLFRFGYEQVKANLAPNGIPDPNPRMLPAPLTLESPEWKAMSMGDKMDYVMSPVEMTAEQKEEYDQAVQRGDLTAGTPVVARDRAPFLTARYGLASAAPRGKMSVWSDDAKAVAVAFSESPTMPTRPPDVRMLPQDQTLNMAAGIGDPSVNLRQKRNRRPGTGVGKNAAFRMEVDGKPLWIGSNEESGGKPFNAWVEETEAWYSDKEIDAAAAWYGELHDMFVAEFGEADAPKMMLAWLSAQQNESPGGAVRNTYRVKDGIAGLTHMKKGGLADDKLRSVFMDTIPDGGYGAKLSDFVDAGMGKKTRTYMGDDPAGGRPFVADVHTGRDSGHVDQQTLTRLKNSAERGKLTVNGKPAKVKVTRSKNLTVKDQVKVVPEEIEIIYPGGRRTITRDLTGSPSNNTYEGIAEWGENLTAYLNKTKWKGRTDWSPEQVQAVGWMRVLRQYGLKEATLASSLDENTYRISAEVDYGLSSSLRELYPEFSSFDEDTKTAITRTVMEKTIPEIVNLVAPQATFRGADFGQGYWEGSAAPSSQFWVLGSNEAAGMVEVALAHATEQAGTARVRFGVGGKNNRAVILPQMNAETSKRFIEFVEATKKSSDKAAAKDASVINGASTKVMPNKDGLVMFGLTESSAKRAINTLQRFVEETGLDLDFEDVPAEASFSGHDWTTDPKGETYRKAFIERGGPEALWRDVLRFREQYAGNLEDAFQRHSPGSLDPAGRQARVDAYAKSAFAEPAPTQSPRAAKARVDPQAAKAIKEAMR
jgi:hypothetical protein